MVGQHQGAILNTDAFEKQLEAVLKDFQAFQSNSKYDDLSDLPKHERQALITRAIAAVHRIAGTGSTYAKEIDRLLVKLPHLHEHTTSIAGVVGALLADLKGGYIQSLVEVVHGSIFGDFLEMAQHLQDSGYKDAAAVIAGSTLESHLRELCSKAGIPLENNKADGSITPKKADLLNSELAAGGIYSKLDQKNVTAWLDLRNKAAHGKYAEYSAEQAGLLIAGIRDFLTRYPA
jgi:hypothetical protein